MEWFDDVVVQLSGPNNVAATALWVIVDAIPRNNDQQRQRRLFRWWYRGDNDVRLSPFLYYTEIALHHGAIVLARAGGIRPAPWQLQPAHTKSELEQFHAAITQEATVSPGKPTLPSYIAAMPSSSKAMTQFAHKECVGVIQQFMEKDFFESLLFRVYAWDILEQVVFKRSQNSGLRASLDRLCNEPIMAMRPFSLEEIQDLFRPVDSLLLTMTTLSVEHIVGSTIDQVYTVYKEWIDTRLLSPATPTAYKKRKREEQQEEEEGRLDDTTRLAILLRRLIQTPSSIFWTLYQTGRNIDPSTWIPTTIISGLRIPVHCRAGGEETRLTQWLHQTIHPTMQPLYAFVWNHAVRSLLLLQMVPVSKVAYWKAVDPGLWHLATRVPRAWPRLASNLLVLAPQQTRKAWSLVATVLQKLPPRPYFTVDATASSSHLAIAIGVLDSVDIDPFMAPMGPRIVDMVLALLMAPPPPATSYVRGLPVAWIHDQLLCGGGGASHPPLSIAARERVIEKHVDLGGAWWSEVRARFPAAVASANHQHILELVRLALLFLKPVATSMNDDSAHAALLQRIADEPALLGRVGIHARFVRHPLIIQKLAPPLATLAIHCQALPLYRRAKQWGNDSWLFLCRGDIVREYQLLWKTCCEAMDRGQLIIECISTLEEDVDARAECRLATPESRQRLLSDGLPTTTTLRWCPTQGWSWHPVGWHNLSPGALLWALYRRQQTFAAAPPTTTAELTDAEDRMFSYVSHLFGGLAEEDDDTVSSLPLQPSSSAPSPLTTCLDLLHQWMTELLLPSTAPVINVHWGASDSNDPLPLGSVPALLLPHLLLAASPLLVKEAVILGIVVGGGAAAAAAAAAGAYQLVFPPFEVSQRRSHPFLMFNILHAARIRGCRVKSAPNWDAYIAHWRVRFRAEEDTQQQQQQHAEAWTPLPNSGIGLFLEPLAAVASL